MASPRTAWKRLTPHAKALLVAAAGTGAVVGGTAVVGAILARRKKPLASLQCGTARSKGRLLGVDVAHWQEKIDWDAACEAGLSFAFVKATQDSHITDSRFEYNWSEVKRVKLFRGAYHFAVPPDPTSKHKQQHHVRGGPREQAEHFYKVVGKLGGARDLPPVIDLEWAAETPAKTADWAKACLERTEDLFNRRPMIYTTTNFIKNRMGNPAWIKKYMFWQAVWTNAKEPPYEIEGMPWTFWQFDNRGKVRGIPKGVDLNRFFGTPKQLAQVARGKVLPARSSGAAIA